MSHPAPPGGGRLGLTTRRQVVIAALLGALVGYFVIGTLRWRDISVPPSPWSLVVTLVLLAAAALTATPVLRRKILTERALVAPETGLLALVSGKSLLMMGSCLVGAHLVYVGATLGTLQVPISQERAIRGSIVLVLSLVVAWSGARLEKACVVPDDDDDQDTDQDRGMDA